MKSHSSRYIILLLLLLLSTIGFSNAYLADDTLLLSTKHKNKKEYPFQPTIIKTSPTALLWGGVFPFTAEYRLMVEMPSNRTQSEQIAFSILGKSIFWRTVERSSNQPRHIEFKVTGWRLQYAHKFYVVNRRHHSPFGFYVAPLVSYTSAKIALSKKSYYKGSYFEINQYNINAIIGVQASKNAKLKLDIYAGMGYKNNLVYFHKNTYKVAPYDTKDFGDFYNSHFNLVFGINLGIAL